MVWVGRSYGWDSLYSVFIISFILVLQEFSEFVSEVNRLQFSDKENSVFIITC